MKVFLTLFFVFIFALFSFGQESTNNDTVVATDRDKAIELYTQEDYKSAVSLFDKVLTADNNDYNSWLYFAMGLLRIDDSKDSATAFERVMKLRKQQKPQDKPIDTHGFKITSKPHAPFTDEGRGVTGITYLAIEFRADGKIGMIVPLNKLPGGLTLSAYRAAKEIKFNPYLKDGKPLTVIKIIEYSFRTE